MIPLAKNVDDSCVDSYRSALKAWPSLPVEELHPIRTVSKTFDLSSPVFLLFTDILLWLLSASVCGVILNFLGITLYIANLRVLIIPFVVSLFAVWLVGAYDRHTTFVSLRYTAESLIAGVASMIVTPGLVALFGNYGGIYQPSRLTLFLLPGIFSVLSLLSRRRIWGLRGGYATRHRIILIGTPEEAASLESALLLSDRLARVTNLPVENASEDSLTSLLSNQDADFPLGGKEGCTVVISSNTDQKTIAPLRPFLISLHTSTVPVYSWSAFWSLRVRMHDSTTDSAGWLFDKDYQFSGSSPYGHLKRLMDVVISAMALILSLPILILAAVAIRLDSRGPVLFVQNRIGQRGNTFRILKLRTMANGSESEGKTTVKNDARLTRIGKWLRQIRIDEIPQLWNVLKGDMSIVGPRPEWTVCVENYENQIHCYHLRHLVKPGITGWAQVNYPYGEGIEDARKKLAFDLFYISNASLIMDFCIILKTVYVLMGRFGGR